MTDVIEIRPRNAPAVAYKGRGVYEIPLQRIPGRRCFVALDSNSVEVASVNLPASGDEGFVRLQLAALLVEVESGA